MENGSKLQNVNIQEENRACWHTNSSLLSVLEAIAEVMPAFREFWTRDYKRKQTCRAQNKIRSKCVYFFFFWVNIFDCFLIYDMNWILFLAVFFVKVTYDKANGILKYNNVSNKNNKIKNYIEHKYIYKNILTINMWWKHHSFHVEILLKYEVLNNETENCLWLKLKYFTQECWKR